MAILSKGEMEEKRPEIDLTGPDGNAFALMAYATKWAKQLKLDPDGIIEEMKQGDFVTFYR